MPAGATARNTNVVSDSPDFFGDVCTMDVRALPADVRAGRRRKPVTSLRRNDHANSAPSTIANFLTTVAPVILATSASSSTGTPTLPTTTTWFPVENLQIKRTRSDEQLATAAAKKRKRLGQCKMKRDRLVQEIARSQHVNRNLHAKLTATNTRIAKLQSAQTQLPTARQVFTHAPCVLFIFILVHYGSQVYQVLEEHYRDCPWPVPPHAILMHLPVQEQRAKGLTSEAILRQIVGKDKRMRHCFRWDIRDVEVRPDFTLVYIIFVLYTIVLSRALNALRGSDTTESVCVNNNIEVYHFILFCMILCFRAHCMT